jgi:decaprenylphospho-beta-D-erythro-pentofuranosid-2-ulose 2-reductase
VAGLDSLAQGLGDSLAGSGVRVLVVRPGFVKTRMTSGLKPAPFAVSAEAVAGATVAGPERGADTVWAPGSYAMCSPCSAMCPARATGSCRCET